MSFAVLKPLMPVGVDHFLSLAGDFYGDMVLKPLMPVGVDHRKTLLTMPALSSVLKPLMPVGVDHARYQEKLFQPVWC